MLLKVGEMCTFYAYWGPIGLNLLFSLQGVAMDAPS